MAATIISAAAAALSPTTPSLVLRKVLTHPCKVASIMDWKKSLRSNVLSMTIHKDSIGLAIASHPSLEEEVTVLDSLQLSSSEKKKQARPTLYDFVQQYDQLLDVVKQHEVCGMLVSWPLEEETGKMGASCGRVLYTLETLMFIQGQYESNKDIKVSPKAQLFCSSRPICLWDSHHYREESVDEWGRGLQYSQPSSQAFRRKSSKEDPVVVTKCEITGEMIETHHYEYQDESLPAELVWDVFCRMYWPDLYYDNHLIATSTRYQHTHQGQPSSLQHVQRSGNQQHHKSSSSTSNYLQNDKQRQAWMKQNDGWEDSASFVNAALL